MDQIKVILDYLKDPLVVWGPLGIAIVIGLIIFFINFKKKQGLIYIAVSFLITGGFLLSLKSIADLIIDEYVAEYKTFIDTFIVNILKEATTVAYLYLGVAVICIIVFILIKIFKKKSVEVKEEGSIEQAA